MELSRGEAPARRALRFVVQAAAGLVLLTAALAGLLLSVLLVMLTNDSEVGEVPLSYRITANLALVVALVAVGLGALSIGWRKCLVPAVVALASLGILIGFAWLVGPPTFP